MYGCGILICLSEGFRSVVIFSSSIEVQSRIGMFTNGAHRSLYRD